MVFLRKTLYLVIVLILANSQQLRANSKLPVEQEQQFTYYWYAAMQAITDERYTDAYALLQFCNTLKPDDGRTLSFLGRMYDSLGKDSLAKETFRKAYEVDPNNEWENYLEPLKQQYIEREEWKKALKTQDEIDRRKGEYDAYSAITRYRIYAMWKKPKEAVKAIDKYLEIDPTNLRFLLFRVELAEQIGVDKKELYAWYDRVLEVDPYNAVILNNYAYHLATNHGDLDKAEQMSSLAMRAVPGSSTFMDTYGWILFLKGQEDLGLFYINRAWFNASDEERPAISEHKRIAEMKIYGKSGIPKMKGEKLKVKGERK